jgi:hypothetical protein
MKLATLTSVVLLLSAGYALAQATPNSMSSGRPSAVLNPDQCKAVWTMASPDGATLSKDKAVPYVVNFTMVDTDNDGTIDANEFMAACGKGMIQSSKAP